MLPWRPRVSPHIREWARDIRGPVRRGPLSARSGGWWRPVCLPGHVRLELRNVVAKYPFERSLRFPGIQQNSDHRDYSPLSCGVGWTQLGPRTQGITEETATPWGRPESFSIEGARRLRSSGAPRMSLRSIRGYTYSSAGGKPTTREEKGHA